MLPFHFEQKKKKNWQLFIYALDGFIQYVYWKESATYLFMSYYIISYKLQRKIAKQKDWRSEMSTKKGACLSVLKSICIYYLC